MTRLMSGLSLSLLIAAVVSLHAGLTVYSPVTVLSALSGHEGTDALIITTLRVPRTLIGLCAGAALGLSGMLMQSVTRNPLAEPGLLGINAGAALCVTIAATFLAFSSLAGIGGAAILGAVLTTAAVFVLSTAAGGAGNPATTLLAGFTIAALLASFTQALLLVDETALEALLFWLSGSFADRPISLLALGLPLLVIGGAGSLFLASSLDALRLDDASAHAVGVNVTAIRLAALAFAALLAAGAVAMAGPVLFLGLVAPHLARRMAGNALPPTRPLAMLSMLVGALIAVVADILARVIVAPGEAPMSAVLALVGVPTLIHLLRRGKGLAA